MARFRQIPDREGQVEMEVRRFECSW
jgi:hypothetical protein